MNKEIKNYGFIPSVIENDHYVFGDGALAPQILMPDGQWDKYLPVDDVQNKNNVETDNCTNYGTEHALATLGNFKFNCDKNGNLLPIGQRPFQTLFSERYTGVLTGTTIYGNDPHKVIEIIRLSCGLIPQVFLPFDASIDSWQKYYSPNPMKYSLYAMGAHWLKKYKVGHDWVWLPGDTQPIVQQKIKTALEYSPLGVSGFAWSQHADGKYYSDEPYQNHWYTIYGYVEGQYWKAFDSYDNTHKQLDWNYTFGQGKRYTLDYNVGGQTLGEAPDQVVVSYVGYLVGELFKNLLK